MGKEVKFSHLKIINFKGIKEVVIDFSDTTEIKGDNGTGKSTIFDALTWCLFGKNSLDAKDFSIKNTINTSLNRADHSVKLTMSIDGEEVVAERIYKEKWTKRRGSEDHEFTGHETILMWNDVPCSAGEYQKKVGEIVEEQLFKQITNPLFFNSTMKWQDRRDTLVKMAGEVTDEKVINGTVAFRTLMDSIRGKKTLEEYRKEIAAKKTGIKKQLVDIPARIDELIKSNPVTENWEEIQDEIKLKEAAIRAINEDIESINKAFDTQLIDIKARQAKVTEAARHMSDIKIELSKKSYADASTANKDLNEAKYQLGVVRSDLRAKELHKTADSIRKNKLELELVQLRKDFEAENEKVFVFDRDACKCPTCQRAFESATIEEKETNLFDNFRTAQNSQKVIIRANGIAKAAEETAITNGLLTLVLEITDLKEKEKSLAWAESSVPAQPKDIEALLLTHAQYLLYKAVSETQITVTQPDIAEQKEMKLQIQEGIDELKTKLWNKEQIEKNTLRVSELLAEEKKYGQELASLEKTEFTIEDFNKTKMNMIESSINNRFKLVKFKLFETQINGGETPCCETMVNSVPYSDLNHAMQINSGIDIINALSGYYGVTAPITVDNAEAVNVLEPTDSQLIRLVVTKDPQLVITNN